MARRPKREQVDFDEWLLNVHDVFMNAQLLRTLCDNEPVEHDFSDPGVFMTSRRGRLERGAMRDLYVLVEASVPYRGNTWMRSVAWHRSRTAWSRGFSKTSIG